METVWWCQCEVMEVSREGLALWENEPQGSQHPRAFLWGWRCTFNIRSVHGVWPWACCSLRLPIMLLLPAFLSLAQQGLSLGSEERQCTAASWGSPSWGRAVWPAQGRPETSSAHSSS